MKLIAKLDIGEGQRIPLQPGVIDFERFAWRIDLAFATGRRVYFGKPDINIVDSLDAVAGAELLVEQIDEVVVHENGSCRELVPF